MPAGTDGTPTPPFVTSRKKSKNANTPRPPNAFILFRSAFVKNHYVPANVEANSSTLSKIIGMTWRHLPEVEKSVWRVKAQVALEEHKHKFPEYRFQSPYARVNNRKHARANRRVRDVERKDSKRCEKLAQLLVTGKKREELEQEIQEFDKTYVPETVRFRTPITVESFRPVDETSSHPSSACETIPITSDQSLPADHQLIGIRVNSLQQSDSLLIPPANASNSSRDIPTPTHHAFIDVPDNTLFPTSELHSSQMPPSSMPLDTLPANSNFYSATGSLTPINPPYTPNIFPLTGPPSLPHLSSHNEYLVQNHSSFDTYNEHFVQNHFSPDVYSNCNEIFSPSFMLDDMLQNPIPSFYPTGAYLTPEDPESYNSDIFPPSISTAYLSDLGPPLDPVSQLYETEPNISSMTNILTALEGFNWEC